MASVSRSLDLAGSHWGLRKKTQRQTYRKAWDWVGPALLVRDAGDPLRLQVHLFIQQVWESGVNCRLSSHGSSCVGGRNNAAVVCCYLLHTILTTSACPVFPARQPCRNLSPLGWVRAYQPRGPLTELCSCQDLSPLPQSPLVRQPCWTLLTSFVPGPCLLSTKVFDIALHISKFLLSLFRYWSPIVLLLWF
jgi:hypothetical protein